MSHTASRRSTGMLTLLITCAMFAPSAARAQTDEQLIRALDSTFNIIVVARDTARLATLYAPSAVGMYPNSPVATGAPAIVRSHAELFAMPNLKLFVTPTSIRVSKGGDFATSTGTYQLSFTSPSGPVVDSGSYVEILQKGNDGKWRIINEIVTSHAPMQQAAAATYDLDANMAMAGGSGLQWGDLNVPGFDPGAKIAVVHGDPAANGDYTVRLQFPDGYHFPVHWHPKAEHLTVLSGTFLLGMGTKVDRTVEKTYGPGDFLYLPAKNTHFGGSKGVTVIQLHGMGPFTINLGTP